MGKFTVIPQNTFDALQMDAGVLLKRFDPANPVAPDDADIICATTGGINPTCVPTYSDFGEDVDNVPLNMMEFKHLDSWECKISTTGLGTSAELIRLALGAADIVEGSKVVPRASIKLTDYSDLWWVGDKANGGCVAIQLKNALSTGGFSLQTTKNAKGTVGIEITGHVSINAQAEIPMVFYSIDPDADEFSITQTLTHITSDFTDETVQAGAPLEATLTADTDYVIGTVTVTMDGVDVTTTAWDTTTSKVYIANVTGDVVITAVGSEGV